MVFFSLIKISFSFLIEISTYFWLSTKIYKYDTFISEGNTLSSVDVIFLTEKPSKPLDLKVASVDKDRMTLAWSPPESDGGTEIFNYVIEYREEGAKKWKVFNKENIPKTTGTVTGLKKDKMYEFRVAAENKAGVGPYSDPTAPVQAKEHIGRYHVVFK